VAAAGGAADGQDDDRLWWAAGVLYRRVWLVGAVTVLVAVLSVVLTLQMPNQYQAETRVLLPEGGGGLGGLLDNIPAAAGLLGGSPGEFTRYMAILTSRETMESVIDRFGLVEVYDLEDVEHPEQAALWALEDKATFVVSPDYDYLAVRVLDESPRRAAQMANFFVERLNERNAAFTSSAAADNREFLERRVGRAETDLDSALADLQELQERSGVIEPEAQATALMSALATAQGAATVAEAEYAALLSQYGPENETVRAARAAFDAARAQVDRLAGGGEAVMPVPIQGLPLVQRQYAQAMQEVVMQQTILTTLMPLYEQAVLQEQRESDAVQVLDVAVPPERKAAPRRSVLVLVATLTGLLLAVAFVLLHAWWRRHSGPLARRLRASVEGAPAQT
jgi:uncharacterized protein involved in exopolysaccharide biosynthesis